MEELLPDSLIGAYRVIRTLGAGGMGTVYEVEHNQLGVHYALKTFVLDHGHVELLRERFLAEGRVLARLRHPNLVRVFDLGVDAERGVLYFVMGLVYAAEEVDPLRSGNRRLKRPGNVDRWLVTGMHDLFRIVVGPDLVAEKKAAAKK